MRSVLVVLITCLCLACCLASAGLDVTILYDNYVFREGLEADWGFACLIEGLDKTILFDTGTRGNILLGNAEKLDVDFNDVDVVVISHDHGDHYGGLDPFLQLNSDDRQEDPQGLRRLSSEQGIEGGGPRHYPAFQRPGGPTGRAHPLQRRPGHRDVPPGLRKQLPPDGCRPTDRPDPVAQERFGNPMIEPCETSREPQMEPVVTTVLWARRPSRLRGRIVRGRLVRLCSVRRRRL